MGANVDLRPYLVAFACYYFLMILAGVLALFFLSFLDFELPNSWGSIVATASACATGQRFVKANQRPFSTSEKWKMVFMSLLIALAISFLLAAGLYFSPLGGGLQPMIELIRETSLTFHAITFGVVSLWYIAILYVSYGWLTNFAFKMRQKRRAAP